MTPGWLNRVDQALAELARHDSDAARSDRVRVRCHDALRRAAASGPTSPRQPSLLPEAALIGAFCAVYLCAIVLNALRGEGLL